MTQNVAIFTTEFQNLNIFNTKEIPIGSNAQTHLFYHIDRFPALPGKAVTIFDWILPDFAVEFTQT